MLLNYMILKCLINQIFRSIQTPSGFKLPYSDFRFLLFWKQPTFLWKRICFLHSVGFISLEHTEKDWYIAVTEKGCSFVLDCNIQFVKGFFSAVLALSSAVLGFVVGSL